MEYVLNTFVLSMIEFLVITALSFISPPTTVLVLGRVAGIQQVNLSQRVLAEWRISSSKDFISFLI